jgi:hypothetical protein
MANLIDLLQAYDEKSGTLPSGRRLTERLQRKFLARIAKASKGFLRDCEFRPVESAAEFMNVSKIAQNEIRHSPTVEAEFKSRWFSLSQATNRAISFVCMYKNQHILGTVSMLLDSVMGLPSDQIYKTNINQFRTMGREMAEITTLILNNEVLNGAHFSRTDRLVLALKLMKAAVEYAKNSHDVDTVMIRCNRRHEMLHKALFYRPLTGLEYYTGKDREVFPAFFLDLDFLEENGQLTGSRLWALNFSKKEANPTQKPFHFTLNGLMQTFSMVRTAA